MKSITPVICLIIGAAAGFASGNWHGEAITLQAETVALRSMSAAPGVDPVYVADVSERDLAKTRARITPLR